MASPTDSDVLRVVHVLGGRGQVGGAEKVVAALLDASPDIEHRVLVPFATMDEAAPLTELFGGARTEAYGATSALTLPRARSWLARRVTAVGAGIVHAHLFHAEVLVATLRKSARPPAVLTHHHGSFLKDSGRSISSALDRWAGGRFERIVAVSSAVAAFLQDDYGYQQGRIDVIPNGWRGNPRPRVVSDDQGTTFLCVANLRREKGHELLLAAFEQVVTRDQGAELVLVGDGPCRKSLESSVAAMGLLSSVRFEGYVEDPWPYYARADVVVLASASETQGITVLEAMAAGCPVVATAVGGIPEAVAHGKTGLLVEPGSAEDLAAAMTALATSPGQREAMGERARDASQHWKMERTVARYEALYRELAGLPRREAT